MLICDLRTGVTRYVFTCSELRAGAVKVRIMLARRERRIVGGSTMLQGLREMLFVQKYYCECWIKQDSCFRRIITFIKG